MRKVLVAALAALALPVHAFDLQGHRGARGLAPENTLPAFARAAEIGVATLELDTGITKDGVVIVAHDRRLNPDITRGANGDWIAVPGPRVRDLTLAELKRFDVGAIKPGTDYAKQFAAQIARPGTTMPTLAEVAAFPGRFNIETKISPLMSDDTLDPEAFARTLIAEIRRLGIASRATIQSFDWRTLAVAAREAPEIARAYLTTERGANETVFKGKGASPWTGIDAAQHGNSTPRVVKAAGGAIWSPFWRDITPEIVAEAKALGLTVIPWTVNDPTEMARLIDMKIDGLITDYPDRAKALLDARGIAVR
ncbi:MAG: glycerophosphodiester phosphodiesterase [Alphaproteobacteria bacterium]|nr:glycerophosphodiester phosphodiesterase [Alphaproteobacteria bacterium]